MTLIIILLAAGLLFGGLFKQSFCKAVGAICLGAGLLLLAWHLRMVFVWIAVTLFIAVMCILFSPFLVGSGLVVLAGFAVCFLGALLVGWPFLLAAVFVTWIAWILGTAALGIMKRSPFSKGKR